ncbi:hypothetical protein TNCV_2516591 [Trichonephila clavipes]|nr:hypothetical protein TNCV_2516591 [Trichonephila clavipes]
MCRYLGIPGEHHMFETNMSKTHKLLFFLPCITFNSSVLLSPTLIGFRIHVTANNNLTSYKTEETSSQKGFITTPTNPSQTLHLKDKVAFKDNGLYTGKK